jgi:hypothetical protein
MARAMASWPVELGVQVIAALVLSAEPGGVCGVGYRGGEIDHSIEGVRFQDPAICDAANYFASFRPTFETLKWKNSGVEDFK